MLRKVETIENAYSNRLQQAWAWKYDRGVELNKFELHDNEVSVYRRDLSYFESGQSQSELGKQDDANVDRTLQEENKARTELHWD